MIERNLHLEMVEWLRMLAKQSRQMYPNDERGEEMARFFEARAELWEAGYVHEKLGPLNKGE